MFLVNNFIEIITKKYFCFEGRASRKEFWMFFLALVIINAIVNVIARVAPAVGGILSLIVFLAFLLPTLGAAARRLHDTGKSGWMQLLALIPFVGGIIVLVLCALEGQKEANQYGEVPACGCCCGGEGEQK